MPTVKSIRYGTYKLSRHSVGEDGLGYDYIQVEEELFDSDSRPYYHPIGTYGNVGQEAGIYRLLVALHFTEEGDSAVVKPNG
jgi:hypothetical protein